jgi:DNA adenine methylase
LFRLVSNIKGDFLMTYDSHPDVRALALRYEFDLEEIEMRNTHHSKRTELLIGKDLSWIRDSAKQMTVKLPFD